MIADDERLNLSVSIQNKVVELEEELMLEMFELFNQEPSDHSFTRFTQPLHNFIIKQGNLFDHFIDECSQLGMGSWLFNMTNFDVMDLYSEDDEGVRVYLPSNNTEFIIETAFIAWSKQKKGGIK